MASSKSIYSGYSGAWLRHVRAKNGISRPPALLLARLQRLGWRPVVHFALMTETDSGLRWVRGAHPKGPAARRRVRRFARMLAEVMPGGGKVVMTAEGVSVSSMQPLTRDPVTGHLRVYTGG